MAMSVSTFHQAFRTLDAARDPDLAAYFHETASLKALGNFGSSTVIALGLKGIGKSAAFRYLTEFDNQPKVSQGISPDTHTLFLPDKNLHYSTCRKQFEHDIVLEALRAIAEGDSDGVPSSLRTKARRHVKSYKDTLQSVAGRFGGMSILGCGFTLNAPEAPVLVGVRSDSDIGSARDLLEEICQNGVSIRIVIDDPEQVFSASRLLDTHLVGGFFLAALRLSDEIPGLKVIALVKTHVYHPVVREIEDLGKYRDHLGRLSWTGEELLELVAKRLDWADVTWTEVFRGTESSARKLITSLGEVVRNGPRDLIRWVDLALQLASGRKVTKKHFAETRRRMAAESLRELAAAHSAEYERIDAVIKVVFSDDPARQYTLAELKSRVADLLVTDHQMMALSRLPWMQVQTSSTLPEVFFEVGAVSVISGGRPTLPYEEQYDLDRFESADGVGLVPGLQDAIA